MRILFMTIICASSRNISVAASMYIGRIIIASCHNSLYNHESFDTRHYSLYQIDNNANARTYMTMIRMAVNVPEKMAGTCL